MVFLLSLAAQMTDRFVSKIRDVAFIGPFVSLWLMPAGDRGPHNRRRAEQAAGVNKSVLPETLLIKFSCRIGPPFPCCWWLTSRSLTFCSFYNRSIVWFLTRWRGKTLQSSILSLHAVCKGNDSIAISKAELQAGIIGSSFTILHNRGPVSCIWSTMPCLPSPHRARHSYQAPSLSFQTAASGTGGELWGGTNCSTALQPVGACACRHICTLQRLVFVEPCYQKARFSSVCHCCASASCAPSFPVYPYAGSQHSHVQGVLALWHCFALFP